MPSLKGYCIDFWSLGITSAVVNIVTDVPYPCSADRPGLETSASETAEDYGSGTLCHWFIVCLEADVRP